LASKSKSKMEELEACHKMMINMKSSLWNSSPLTDSSVGTNYFSHRAAKSAYIDISHSILMIGKGIVAMWSPISRRCSDFRLKTHLVSSLEKVDTLSCQLKAVIRMKSNDIYDMDEDGTVLACALNLVSAVNTALLDLEAAGIRIHQQ
jgi:hypothetical protein